MSPPTMNDSPLLGIEVVLHLLLEPPTKLKWLHARFLSFCFSPCTIMITPHSVPIPLGCEVIQNSWLWTPPPALCCQRRHASQLCQDRTHQEARRHERPPKAGKHPSLPFTVQSRQNMVKIAVCSMDQCLLCSVCSAVFICLCLGLLWHRKHSSLSRAARGRKHTSRQAQTRQPHPEAQLWQPSARGTLPDTPRQCHLLQLEF